jgi:hypothetical protein
MKDSAACLDDAIWAISGESIFFDAQRVMPSRGFIEAAKAHARKHQLWEQYIPLDFIPSTCFATNRQKWTQISATRGQTNGDVELCHRCRTEGKKCLFPVVARVKDVGMLHPDGYSVSIHTAENVTSVKNCYLVSGDIRPWANVMPELRPFDGNAGLLFWRSTKLNGFDDVANNEPTHEPLSISQQSTLLRDARRAGLDADWDLALRRWRELKSGGLVTPEVGANIGLCLFKLGERDKARGAIQNVLSVHPDDSYAQSIMAHILEAGRDFAGASDIWNKLRDRPGLPEWLTASAINGALRCNAAGTAFGSKAT